MSCTIPECQSVISSTQYCYVNTCTSGGNTYPKTMASRKELGCNYGGSVWCDQFNVGCCY